MKKETEKGRQTRRRFERALGPVGAGLVLDLADFATFGPLGLVAGFLIGSLAGWYLTGALRFPEKWRLPATLLAGLYCTIPFTEFLPLATLIGAMSRFSQKPPGTGGPNPPGEDKDVIDIGCHVEQ